MNMMMKWKPLILRDREGEGAGGAGDISGASDAGGNSPAPGPADDQLKRFEERLNRMSQQMDTSERQRKEEAGRRRLQEHEDSLAAAIQTADKAVTDAEAALADAYDNGEGVEIAKAQRALSEAVAKKERANADADNYKERLRAAERRDGGSGGTQPKQMDTTNLTEWKTKHASWYGVNADMTKASHEIDRQIREAGVLSVGSKEYFDAVDREMTRRFPDQFGGTPNTAVQSQGQNSPQPRSRGKISQSIADGWRRMGINVDDPKVLDRMLKNRESAVQKGILSETPVEGAVRTR